MARGGNNVMTNAESASFQPVVTEITALVLQQVAPEELIILPETAREFFADPAAILDPRRQDEALGFGIDIALLAPYVLAVGGPVVGYLASIVGAAAKDAATEAVKPMIADRIRGLFRRSVAPAVPPGGARPPASPGLLPPQPGGSLPMPALSGEQAHHIRDLVRDRARAVGLPDPQADLLADAFIGGLVVRG
jgi:hypothetical protein